jgi:hypothetical protein
VSLNREDYLEIGETLDLGQKIRINHESPDCSGNSKSLLITRKENGDINAYCFRCGSRGGVYNTSRYKALKSRTIIDSTSEVLPVNIGSNETLSRFTTLVTTGSKTIAEWPPKARLWITRYGITQDEVTKHGIFYSDTINRVVLPVYDASDIQSYQTRKIYDDDTGPKYLSYNILDGIHHMAYNGGYSDILVMVEDYLSGIICSRYCDVLILQSTSLLDKHLNFLLYKKYKEHIIFLDDDNLQVKKNALKIKNNISKFGGNANIVSSGGRDPKEHSDPELRFLLLKVPPHVDV